MSPRNILVFGATGPQGSGLTRALVNINAQNPQPKYKIHAVTRDPTAEKSQALVAQGNGNVKLKKWEDDNLESLFKDQDIYGVFSVQTAMQGRELETGNEITDLSVKYKVQHLVWNGIDYANTTEKDTVPDHVANKRQIEAHIRASGLRFTLFKPTWFYEAFYWAPLQDAILTILNPDRVYKMISTEDIGRIVSEAFEHPDQWVGKELNLGADGLKPAEIAQIWEEVTGNELQDEKKPEFPEVVNQTWNYVNNHEYAADVEENRRLFPFVKDLKTWLKTTPFAKAA